MGGKSTKTEANPVQHQEVGEQEEESGGFHLLEIHAPTAGLSFFAVFLFIAIALGTWFLLRRYRARRARKRHARQDFVEKGGWSTTKAYPAPISNQQSLDPAQLIQMALLRQLTASPPDFTSRIREMVDTVAVPLPPRGMVANVSPVARARPLLPLPREDDVVRRPHDRRDVHQEEDDYGGYDESPVLDRRHPHGLGPRPLPSTLRSE